MSKKKKEFTPHQLFEWWLATETVVLFPDSSLDFISTVQFTEEEQAVLFFKFFEEIYSDKKKRNRLIKSLINKSKERVVVNEVEILPPE